MRRGGDRDEFGESLHNAEKKCVKESHELGRTLCEWDMENGSWIMVNRCRFLVDYLEYMVQALREEYTLLGIPSRLVWNS